MVIARAEFAVEADYHQYYVDDGGDLPDVAVVDASFDGIVGLDVGHARVFSAVQWGRVDVTVVVTDDPISLPQAVGSIATAFTMQLRTGRLHVRDWESSHPPRFVHDFGRPTTCAVLVEVEGPDEAREDFRTAARRAGETGLPLTRRVWEHHSVTVSTHALGRDRWRSTEIGALERHIATDPGQSDLPTT